MTTTNTSVLALTIIVYVLQMCKITNANMHEAETEFYEYYRDNRDAAIPWTGYQQIFCEFVRPHSFTVCNFTLTNLHLEERPLQFSTIHDDPVPVEILTCTYDYGDRLLYARTPSSRKYYDVLETGTGANLDNVGLVDEIDIPLANVEALFYNHYARHGQDTTFLFPPNMIDSFCNGVRPNGFSVSKIQPQTENMMLFTQGHTKLNIQMLACYFTEIEAGALSYQGIVESFMRAQRYPYMAWFTKGPDGEYYELRMFGDSDHSGLAIRRQVYI